MSARLAQDNEEQGDDEGAGASDGHDDAGNGQVECHGNDEADGKQRRSCSCEHLGDDCAGPLGGTELRRVETARRLGAGKQASAAADVVVGGDACLEVVLQHGEALLVLVAEVLALQGAANLVESGDEFLAARELLGGGQAVFERGVEFVETCLLGEIDALGVLLGAYLREFG